MAAKKRKAKSTTSSSVGSREIRVERALVENLVALQRIMVTLSAKFDNLSVNISKLLELFELSAKSLAKKDTEGKEQNLEMKTIMEKLDSLTQQAGLIGRGLALMHESSSERQMPMQQVQQPMQMPMMPQRPMAPMETQRPVIDRFEQQQSSTPTEGYQRSMGSKVSETTE